jgi:hypothetical protein
MFLNIANKTFLWKKKITEIAKLKDRQESWDRFSTLLVLGSVWSRGLCPASSGDSGSRISS